MKTTMLELVAAVSEFADSDAEVVATVAYMVNSGSVRLCGNFAGARIDLGSAKVGPRGGGTVLRRSLRTAVAA